MKIITDFIDTANKYINGLNPDIDLIKNDMVNSLLPNIHDFLRSCDVVIEEDQNFNCAQLYKFRMVQTIVNKKFVAELDTNNIMYRFVRKDDGYYVVFYYDDINTPNVFKMECLIIS